jgi:hypothetical protein
MSVRAREKVISTNTIEEGTQLVILTPSIRLHG